MKVNADLRERVVIQIDALPWVPSPLPGVERRMLDRDGEEVARATSVVRYAPNSRFDAHTHGGGEEYFVLEGVFSDEHGDFGPGSYVRNPPGSAHTPRSDQGCTIFVKLRQRADEDQTQVSIDTTDAAGWTPGPQPGVEALPLHRYDKEVVRLLRLAPGVRLEAHGHPAGEEILVLEGSFEDEHGRYAKGTWIRNPPGSDHRPSTETGCLLYIKTGHLPA
jgi:anti-sigma factor ChrR (cupin superfamily)